ncbi:hypothetical protein D3C72_1371550 [compost metagenome]
MAVPLERQAQLGAHAVGARHQHGLVVLLGHFEQRAKAADTGQHPGAHGARGEGFDTVDQGVACVDVDTGIAVGQGGFRLIRHEKCRGVCNNCWEFGGTPRILRCCGLVQGSGRARGVKAMRAGRAAAGAKRAQTQAWQSP